MVLGLFGCSLGPCACGRRERGRGVLALLVYPSCAQGSGYIGRRSVGALFRDLRGVHWYAQKFASYFLTDGSGPCMEKPSWDSLHGYCGSCGVLVKGENSGEMSGKFYVRLFSKHRVYRLSRTLSGLCGKIHLLGSTFFTVTFS